MYPQAEEKTGESEVAFWRVHPRPHPQAEEETGESEVAFCEGTYTPPTGQVNTITPRLQAGRETGEIDMHPTYKLGEKLERSTYTPPASWERNWRDRHTPRLQAGKETAEINIHPTCRLREKLERSTYTPPAG